jgi:hypothetical protein
LEFLWSGSTTTLAALRVERNKEKVIRENKRLEAEEAAKRKQDRLDKKKDKQMSEMKLTGSGSAAFQGDPGATQKTQMS